MSSVNTDGTPQRIWLLCRTVPESVPTAPRAPVPAQVPTARIAREWLRLGVIGFGGPPAHIALLRELVVDREQWVDAEQFEDVVAVTALLPGPASTQTAVLTAWLLGGVRGALVGAAGFILPGLVAVIALATVVLAAAPPPLVVALGAGAGAAVPAVAVAAGTMLIGPSRKRARTAGSVLRWSIYVAAGVIATVAAGPYLVLCLLACGFAELLIMRRGRPAAPKTATAASDPKPKRSRGPRGLADGASAIVLPLAAAALAPGTYTALAWMGFKIGALAYGGGFVIVPLMQADAVAVHGWLTDAQFLSAVAIGQVVPGPVVNTGAAIGWSVAGAGGAAIVAAAIFIPTITLAILAGRQLHRVSGSPRAQAFLAGAAPAAIGAILGSAVPLAMVLQTGWQVAILALAAPLLLSRKFGVVTVLLAAALAGVLVWQLGATLPG